MTRTRANALDATRKLVLDKGVKSATVDAIAAESGVPVGSLYHRFRSRDELLAELWIRAVRGSQAAFLAATEHPDPEEAAVRAALSIHEFVQRHREDAALLASFPRHDLIREARSPGLVRELKELNRPVEEALVGLARRLFGKATRAAIEQTVLAVVDVPMGAVRRHLLAGSELPDALAEHLESAVRAILRNWPEDATLMTNLALAGIFLLVSLGLSSSRLRDRLAQRLGEQRFLALYKLITLAALAWLTVAYRAAPTRIVWIAPLAVKLAALPLVLLSFVLVVAGVTTPNPTVVGAAQLFDRPGVVRGILRVTRNSFLWGVALWGLAHVAATGDVASVLMFGSIGALGLVGALLLDAKKATRHGAQWRELPRPLSSVPFLAIAQRHQRLVVAEIGWWRLAVAALVFLLALYGHYWAFGVSPLPRI